MLLRIDGIPIVLFTLFSIAIYCLHHYAHIKVDVPLSVVGTLGTAVAILLGFKNNTAYDRWWEARKIWGGVVNQSRYLGSQLVVYMDKNKEVDSEAHSQLLHELVRRHLAYIDLLRLQLREQPTDEPIEKWLGETDAAKLSVARNKATQILTIQSNRFQELYEDKQIEQFRLFELMNTVRRFFELQGKAERIKNTPLLKHYSQFTTAFVWVFVLLLPLGFIGGMDWKMIPLSIIVSTIFTMLDRAGTYTENPFANNFNDVALTAICRTIEIDMLQQIGVNEVPDGIVANDGILM